MRRSARPAAFAAAARGGAAAARAAATAAAGADAEVAVVGAGVVGLAVARALAARGRDVLLLDAAPWPGTGTSARSSEVIHGCLYYPTGSLKARLCAAGADALYAFCARHGVPHARPGKLVVAPRAAQAPALAALLAAATAAGARELSLLSPAQVAAEAPALRAEGGALLSPRTGIVDSHALMEELRRQVEDFGGTVACNSFVEGGDLGGGRAGALKRLRVRDANGLGELTLRVSAIVNAAGLRAHSVFAALGLPPAALPPLRLAKGSYFALAGGARPPSRRLVYPLPPDAGGLGVHLTLDLGGQARFGPDVEWLPPETRVEDIDYSVDAAVAPRFEAAVREWWPGLPAGALAPAYAGVRPKVVAPGAPAGDFLVLSRARLGVEGAVSLHGVESPGLTASLALGEHVADLLYAD
jgi:L-2-hydroxyglutarate oxidase LhgO